jgi:short-subunit dehydrogenase
VKLKPINQQVVAVVGASSGIGRVTALKFAEKGSKVVVLARSQSGLDSLVEEIRRLGGKATAIAADVADFARSRRSPLPSNAPWPVAKRLFSLA